MSADPGPPLRRIIGAVKLVRSLNKAYREQLAGSAPPSVVLLNDRSCAIAERANELAERNLDEAGAVRELAALAGRHDYDLRVAVAELQRWSRDSRTANYAFRLAEAAQSGSAVSPMTEADERRFQAVDAWQAQDADARYQDLLEVEPRLAEIECLIRAGRVDELRLPPWTRQALDRHQPSARAALTAQIRDGRVMLALSQLVGPDSEHAEHPVAGCRAALSDAETYLASLGSS